MITDQPCAPLLLIVLVFFTRASAKDTVSRVRHGSGSRTYRLAFHPPPSLSSLFLKVAGHFKCQVPEIYRARSFQCADVVQ
jgi:hypothetical protein